MNQKIYYFIRFWSDGRGEPPPQKSLGSTVMTADFLIETKGFAILTPEEYEHSKESLDESLFMGKSDFQIRKSGTMLNVKTDGYYENKCCSKDFKKCHEVVKIKTGLNCVFITDHSPIHNYMAEDSLDAKRMNKGSCGKQSIMRDTEYKKDGLIINQSLVFEVGPLKGEAKGLKVHMS